MGPDPVPRDLSRLLRPRSVAVVGGGAWGRAVLRGLQKMGFAGTLQAVHPRADTLEGVKAVADLRWLDSPPDAVFIGVNRKATIGVVRELAKMGAGGAVCFASGFAESGDGGALSRDLIEAAGDMPIVGPNCYGFINALDATALWPDIHGLVPVDRGVAILTQSSNIALNLTMQTRGLPVAFVGTVGNQAQTGMAEMAEALLAEDRITGLGLHIEGFGDIAAFEAMAATARRLGKPVIALKSGRSDAARVAAVSHTASLAGSDAGAAALLARLGMARVASLEALLEALKLAHAIGPLPANRLAALSCSGGEAGLIADAAAARGLTFAPLGDSQKARLADALGPLVTLANPLDYHAFIWGDAERMEMVFAEMMAGGAVITLLVADFPRSDRCATQDWEVLVAAATAAQRRVGMPLAILSTLPDTMPEAMALRLSQAGLIPLCGLEPALDAVAACIALGAPQVFAPPVLPGPAIGTPVTLTEAEVKTDLSRYGVETPQSAVVATPEAAADWAHGRPALALKGLGLAHKTEAGAVALNLCSPEAVTNAARRIGGTRFLVEEMVTDGVAELLIGVLADPAHGFVLTLGAGGTLTELWADTVNLLLPVRREEIAQALDRLRIAPLLHGYRGLPAADQAAIVSAVMAVQDYVTDHAQQIVEIEINPLIVTPTRAVAVDALVRKTEADQ
ncbi:acetate--CoA ligase family protein [Aestuariicoccus sp. MJ-SS9]|uniref:acetate--CoA ligase family protein n=1 Tax=Aestuariicoccus sp. MJ-SS9 TaxID=3079855 RepID=UPI00290D22AC|nr:acetate--CoA ligase family protein [Aestuariicoccus sp. MJ-SS9]MDU8913101.1 acetate--CoA ligase family protein [Aestuariicoccus sp. MJ-SS9]